MAKHAVYECRGARPAVRIGFKAGVGAIAEEARDGDVRGADLAEQETVRREFAFEIVQSCWDVFLLGFGDPRFVRRRASG